MSALSAAISTELLKARRSRVPWAVAAGFSVAPLVGGVFMAILKDPEGARQLGILGAKAQLTAGVADWPTFLGLLTQAVAMGGLVLFAFLTAWLFGREFADRTVRGLLAIPTPRAAIVTAKMVVTAAWCVGIATWVLLLGLGIGVVVGLPGWTGEMALGAVGTFAVVGLMTIALQATTACVAGVGRGYIPPLGWAVLTLFLAQILAVLGWGPLFPWAVPALLSGAAGPAGDTIAAASYVVVAVASIVGFAATVLWWKRADQAG
jgi:ABC-2 type transport system permease protein